MTSSDPLPTTPAAATKSPYKEMRINELEELRQRGLAKSWTKHFSQAISKVETDLELASVALLELEARKAKAKEFAPSSNEMTQLDMMYMRVSEWKRQCRKKQQETVMLYGRYVEKYGAEGFNPESLMTPQKGGSPRVIVSTPLATADVEELAKAFEMTDIPAFLRPSEASTPSPFDTQKLEEILEEASLQGSLPDAPCKMFGISPKTAVTVVDSDDDDSSIVSGLTTLNSAVTKEVLHDVENKVLDFIKNETEHIRKLIEEEDATSKAAHSISSRPSSQVESIADQSLHKAENMVIAMKQILDDFKKQEAETEKDLKTTMVRRIEAGSEGEEWYEHYDDAFQRHFYVEAKTNTTQWHMPPSVVSSDSSVCDSATAGTASEPGMTTAPKVLDYEEFKPETRQVRRSTRIEKYRKNLRRQRRRRIAASAVLLATMGAAFMYYRHTHPVEVEKMFETATNAVANTFELAQHATTVEQPEKETKAAPKKVVAEVEQIEDSDVITKKTTMEFAAMMESLIFESSKKTEEVVAKEAAIEPKKAGNSNWIRGFAKALLGPPAYKEVNRKCRENGRYCGTHWN